MAINLDAAVLHIVVNTIIIGPVLWLAARVLEGKGKAKLTHGLWIAALGTIIGEVLGLLFLPGVVVTLIVIIVWLALTKHFFNCGWLKALLIAIVAIIFFIVIATVLALLGFVALRALLPRIM